MPRSQSIARHAGGVIIMGFEGSELAPATRKLLRELQPAGVILFARNIVAPRPVYSLLRECNREVATPLVRAVDLEGGAVDRLRYVIAPAPAPAAVAATGSARAFRTHGRLIGAECRALGFNLDFAPVCDLGLAETRAVLGARAASADPEVATRYAREFVLGLRQSGVLGCLKHFPGLGGASLDTHHARPRVTRSSTEMWNTDLLPFRRLSRLAPLVMVGHGRYPRSAPNKDARLPAALSRHWIERVLRQRIGFRGLVVTDDLEMRGVGASAPEAAVTAVAAGADLALICHNEEWLRGAFEAMIREAECDPVFRRRLAEAAERVARFKARRQKFFRFPVAPSTPSLVHLREQLQRFSEAVRAHPPMRPPTLPPTLQ